ncbi:hypothetical protein PAXRUDRAFT_172069 [Paxillus rubicundulus Ve08.2h10]|uniref:Uncharacterized protein n=1 Tax=Paxillus rubicundulus Ve08.2h10 TaxID=930991 RepID=A0A0D0BWH6_9AGAM|nr:hypothetical protein PAXRUDRAFT_172069 [Paxillus rubicundulus Ve08.2h10]
MCFSPPFPVSSKVCQFLDTGDKGSTGNMWKHVRSCWGEDVLKTMSEAKDLEMAHDRVKKCTENGSVAVAFEQKGKGKVSYSHRQHTRAETKGFQCLMKTGRPEYYIPHPTTVSRDVWLVFANVRKRIARMLHEHNGKLSFATDAWTSPNHKAFVAITVHLVHESKPLALVLDIVEVAKVH